MARPRKEQELDIARRAVEETIRLLAQQGDFDVPLTSVAQAVGCTAPALYGHFRNKNALLRAARNEGFGRLYNEKFAVFEQMRGDPFGYLRDGSYAYARFALENPTLYRLMFSPPPKLGVSDDPWSSEAGRQVLSLLLTGLRSSQEHGYLPGADLQRYGFMFWSTIHGAVSLNIQNRLLDHAAKWDSTQSVIDALMEMIAATGPAKHPITS
ncbi:TetR family transcriptional regulator [Haematobacter missouriensis]|uniref:TetR family transcriptional regulator n=1 Tax=Haematobacter missouriensis TaxID=366616 RepID=A0ABX3ZW04_9RHOB|nr:WHG domain-containing protein [Haematobacter missouriensis]KFI26330.1 TetR family transcriptional regulator [Haematobacter missouriensis]OWJ78101.1 TetR family transcriptional regulator [Haematobacter missouriensis]